MKLTKHFKELCTPAMIYFIISAFAIIIALASHVKPAAVLIKAFFVVFWTFVLNFLCKKGYKSVSWFLVLFPYIIILAAAFWRGAGHEGFQEGARFQRKYGGLGKATKQARRDEKRVEREMKFIEDANKSNKKNVFQ